MCDQNKLDVFEKWHPQCTAYDKLNERYRCPGTPDANVLVNLATKSYRESKQYNRAPFLIPELKATQANQK